MPGSSGSARGSRAAPRFAGVGFAEVGSAPSPKAKLNQAKQKNSKRKADISGELGEGDAYLAEAAVYARSGCLRCNKVINPQPILFAAESKAGLALPQFLQLRDERGRTVGIVTVIPPKLLSVGAEHQDSGKTDNLVLLRKFAVLLS